MSFNNTFMNKKVEDKHFEVNHMLISIDQKDKTRITPIVNSNGNNCSGKGIIGSLAETSVWSNEDDSTKIKLNNAQSKTSFKPNFMAKKEQNSQQPTQGQQQIINQSAQNSQIINQNSNQKQNINQKLEQQKTTLTISKFGIKNEFDYLDNNDMNFPELEFEKKIINEIVAPGGIRVQQQRDVLNSFAKDCSTLSPCVIGSLLINKLFSNEQNIVKKRSLYAIEVLVKKYQNYQEYFKRQQFMIQKSQQINLQDDKFISLLNQLLSVINDPTQEISETSEVNFDFSLSNDLSKYGKSSETNQNKMPGKQVSQSSCVNLIDDLFDQPLQEQQVTFTQQNIKQNAPNQGFSFNLINSQGQENFDPNTIQKKQIDQKSTFKQQQQQQGQNKQRLFDKFKPKSNQQTNNRVQQENDLLSMIDDLQIKQSSNQDLLDQIISQNDNNSLTSQSLYPCYQVDQFDVSQIQSAVGINANNVQQRNNNNTIQNPKSFTTINMNFGEVEQNNLEQQYYNQSHFSIDENTPKNTRNNSKQQNKNLINEDAFDFIMM